MSEYQYYEFAAVDRALNEHELDELRAVSTRAHITPTSFVNTYEWGDFKGEPVSLMERYFDAFLYLANWGTRELMLRVPAALLDLGTAQRYCVGDLARAHESSGNVIMQVVSDIEGDDDFDWGGEGRLTSILPVRSEILSGDLRALYLLWLVCVESEQLEDDETEPPVPPGLQALTGSQAALAEFLRIDVDLLGAAASGSALRRELRPEVGLEAWVSTLPASERDQLLVALLRNDDPSLRVATVRRAMPAVTVSGTGTRTVGELLDTAAERREAREQAEQDRRAVSAAAKERQAALAWERPVAELLADGDAVWHRIDALIAAKRVADYDVAVALIAELRAARPGPDFERRLGEIRMVHRRKPALLERLARMGL